MDAVRPWIRVHGVLDGVSTEAIQAVLDELPEGAVGEYDQQVRAVVVTVFGGAELCNTVLRALGASGLLAGDAGNEDAILRYLPERASRPAYWDVLDADLAICTTCSWSTPSGIANTAELRREMRRHTDRVHAGRADNRY